ncbi:MAG: Dyp-type peroxidase [Gammaproteobacteria bacterium]|nr:Dyp-type peroxidase [Gammaproteobacteria bacterium]
MSNAPQPGIFAIDRRCHYYLEYKLDSFADARAATADVATARSALRVSADAPDIVVAFGKAMWTFISPGNEPSDFEDFVPLRGRHGHDAPSTQADLWLWLNGDRPDVNFASAMAMHEVLKDRFRLVLDQPAFTHFDSRDLIGFEDGTANPKGDDCRAAALVPEGEAGAGGSHVLTQRWATDLDAFNALEVAEQEAVIGRTKLDSVELEGDAMPADSHVSRTDVKIDGVGMKVFRRSVPYGNLSERGLYFVSFACEQRRHRVQLERMYGLAEDGIHDRLIEFSRANTGSYFFAPSLDALEQVFAT